MQERIEGYSKLSKEKKIEWLIDNHFKGDQAAKNILVSYWNSDQQLQQLHDDFIENSLTNFYLPYGIAPNFLINGKIYSVPLAIEESSVVAAASKAAKFWIDRGGFKCEVIDVEKVGHIHFRWPGNDIKKLQTYLDSIKPTLDEETDHLTANMVSRGGGIRSVELIDRREHIEGYFQLRMGFDTVDSMGANFINSILEKYAEVIKAEISNYSEMNEEDRSIEVIMCILSNYTPNCLVRAEVSCPIDELVIENEDISPREFANKFETAVRIAEIEPYRAVTHNKGIMNGVDAVVIATGNDFRAVEASCHAYATRNGSYSSLSKVEVTDERFTFSMEIPLAIGTVGGITGLHPLVKFSHQLLGFPNAKDLMQIIAAVGLAQNFSAVRSLITSGIQKGHMKMHLLNVLNQLEATDAEKDKLVEHFKDKVPSYAAIVSAFCQLRGIDHPSELTRN